MHVHIYAPNGEAKFWLEPVIALADSYRFSGKQIREIQDIIEERQDEIKRSWRKFFKS